MNIPLELSEYDYTPNAKEEELMRDGKFSVHNYGMYEKKDDSGKLIHNATFNRKIKMIDNFARNIISHCLNSIYEGNTISYFVEKPENDDLLYFGKNEDLDMIIDPEKLNPFVPFSKDSDGGFNSLFYSSNEIKEILLLTVLILNFS